MKPHLLLDITCLGLGFDRPSTRRGVERQVMCLFSELRNSKFCETSFVATSSLAGTVDFLISQGVDPAEKLRYVPAQLSRSRAARRLLAGIHRSQGDRRLPARLVRRLRAMMVARLTRNEGRLAPEFLDGVDIYHTPHTPFPLPPFPEVVQQRPGLKRFVTIHDLWPYTHPSLYGLDPRRTGPEFDLMQKCFTGDTFAFCMSRSVKEDVIKNTQIRPERIFLAAPAADPELFFPVTDPRGRAEVLRGLGIPDAPYFLALSVPERHKNFSLVVRCLGALAQSGRMSIGNVVIAGRDAAKNEDIRAALKENPGLEGHVFMPGYVPDEKLAALYSGATAFLFPSVAEGFGLPPLEAMQCGTPVIASNTTAIPEVVGDAGILLSPTDVDGWCQAMIEVSGNPALRAGLVAGSIARARLFSWDRYMTAILAGYEAALKLKD